MTREPSKLVSDLLRPEAHALDGAATTVSLRTTHASWVFLVGGHAWKVKRPVDLGFLDFRTAEARRLDCEQEVRLNRRLAPDVYLGVEPIWWTPAGGHALRSPGEIVEWAVHMRRLPEDASAEALLGRGALDAGMLERVAERLAVFLGQAVKAPEFGTPAALARNLEENFRQVAPFVGEVLDQDTLDEVRAFQTGKLRDDHRRFEARVAAGHVREGHGDLRLEHVYFLPDGDGGGDKAEPTFIDCIEFNERFRCGDTTAEIAFLAMELEAVGRPDLAAGLLARFAEASDDFGLYGVLDFYLSYRAWVRGKVAAFLLADPGTTTEIRRRKHDEARRDFALARSFAARSELSLARPFVIAVGGVIGSGKSTLARALGRQLAAPVVSTDRTRKRLAGLEPSARADPELYDEASRECTYADVLRRAREVLSAGRGVILDATFSTHRWRQSAAAAALSAGAAFVFLEAECASPEILRNRLASRRRSEAPDPLSASDATDELLPSFLRHYQASDPSDPGPRFTVDTSGPPDRAVQLALRDLAASGVPVGPPEGA